MVQPTHNTPLNNQPDEIPTRREGVLNEIIPELPTPSLANSIVNQGLRSVSASPLTQLSWQTELQNWVDAAPEDEQAGRSTASERIMDCIINNRQVLDLNHLGLSSLPNILKHCTSLKELICSCNKLESLTLEGFSTLQSLTCHSNWLTSININQCPALQKILCNDNELTSINLNGCSALKELNCQYNKLVTLDLESCPAIKILDCKFNLLTTLHLNGCSHLQFLICGNNPDLHFSRGQWGFIARLQQLRSLIIRQTGMGWINIPQPLQNRNEIHIDVRPLHLRNQGLNAQQNTHTASIHACASQNAVLLNNRNPLVSVESEWIAIYDWVHTLPVTEPMIQAGQANQAYKNQIAQDWMNIPHHLNHIDASSNISVKRFLVLAWVAIHDFEQREIHVSVEEAKQVLIDALYEISRGYNLGEGNSIMDDGNAARTICASGTFNKISEKLVSVVQGMESHMITKKTFTLSLYATIRNHIKTLCSDPESGNVVYQELQENDRLLTMPIWQHIQHSVTNSIREEFSQWPTIAGITLDDLLNREADFEEVLQYLPVVNEPNTASLPR